MSGHAEIELAFQVPAASRAALRAELAGRAGPRRVGLTADYLDTPDLRLAGAGLAWRLRREGGRWVQALKAAGPGALERFEHEAERPDGRPDPEAHADTECGRELQRLLARAREDGVEVGVRCQTEVRRLTRRLRSRGAVIDIAFDEGRLKAGDAVRPLRELEFELVCGPLPALLALAERWRRRFGLVLEPRNKAERGLALAAGTPEAPLRKAALPTYGSKADAAEALGAVLDECLDQLLRNAVALTDGEPAGRGEALHQCRVAIRRLRSALQAFEGWVAAPPAALVDGLRGLFAALGVRRDRDVLAGGIAAELARAGAPPLAQHDAGDAADPVALLRGAATQQLLLAWIAWRAGLAVTDTPADGLKRRARRRLRHWQRRLAADARAFDTLDAAALHRLRKHAKRQRYALEFFAPLLPRKPAARHLQALAAAQQALGEINDLDVARAAYQARVAAEPAAWFAVGWLTARLDTARVAARDVLRDLAALKPLQG